MYGLLFPSMANAFLITIGTSTGGAVFEQIFGVVHMETS